MIQLYLDYKCPHCDEVNQSSSPQQYSGATYISKGTGQSFNYTHHDNTLRFQCSFCYTDTFFNVLLEMI